MCSSDLTGAETVDATFGTATSVTTVAATSTVKALSGSAVTAGGAAGFLATTTAAGLGIYFGSGAPTVSAAQGSLYVRTDGSSTSTRLYVNTNGTTGWTNVTTAT